ncbi:MAG: AI-2E family transporter [Sediminibacterium sp.]
MQNSVHKLPFYIRYTIVTVCMVFSVLILRQASSLLIPLFAGLLLAILLLPIVIFLERFHVPKSAACLVAVFCFIIAFSIVNYFLTAEISGFSKELPNIIAKLKIEFASLQLWISTKFHVNTEQQSDYLSNSLNDMLNGVTGFLYRLFFSLGNIVIWILFVCIYAFFILFYRARLVKFVSTLVGKDFANEMPIIISENKKIIKGYILGLLAEFVIMLVLISSLLLLFGIKYALLLAIITALLNIIPYIGIYTATLLAMLVTYANSNGSSTVTVCIVLLSIHLVDGIILLPRIVGSRMKLNPFMMIVAVIIGDIVWGIPGMFLFIPLAAMFKIVFENIPSLEAWAILLGDDEKKIKTKTTK